uniref:Syntrophin-like 2, isoform C n=1 Tax=Drosophila melanogaster TaxID=7227 RepID=Q0E952_DROME|nr:Syntrophin-like 2, isoform C [Drosophila melanogaster]AAM68502.1 Syntrophin-like 2, isoform C [Drosophila melanogaster]|eukprot:NP_523762.2 Syntrophin-like 2, isoform C [Drosophila melanogaster]
MKLSDTMATPIEEKLDQNLKVRTGMVHVSDGKSRPEPLRLNLTMELLSLQKLEVVTPSSCHPNGPPMESKERMVQITRQKQGGLGLSIKGGAEHKLPILISRIYKDQAADITGQLFVGDAIIKVNGEYITACPHDDAVNILRNAGDIVVLTVKHYRAATPFLQKQLPLMMAYVTRYIYGTDKLRQNAFEVRGLNGISTGVIHCDELAILSQWLKLITDNVVGLTHLQMKLYNRNFAVGERIEYMGWVNEGVINNNISWQSYKPRFLLLKGTEVMLFETPPLNVAGISKALVVYKVYQTMFRIVKESETVDSRQHCFLLQSSGHEPRYLSVETRQELLRIENSWNAAIVTSVIKLGRKTFAVSHHGKSGGLTLDWQAGFSLTEGAESATVWQYKFSQLRGSSDDGKSKLKLHFQDHDSRAIETKELECQVLQSLLFCMHAFLTAKVASVDPAFLSSIQQT